MKVSYQVSRPTPKTPASREGTRLLRSSSSSKFEQLPFSARISSLLDNDRYSLKCA